MWMEVMSSGTPIATYDELYSLVQLFESAFHSKECRSGNMSLTINLIKEALERYPIPDKLSRTLEDIIVECEMTPFDNGMVNILIADALDWEY